MLSKAFTLIELLIVVAIISILAAIAVPNFISAITRSKIARVQADFKNLASAFELYHMDRGVYPLIAHNRFKFGRLTFTNTFDWNCLTTPIGYISTNAFIDPFITKQMHNDEGHKGYNYGEEQFWYEVGHLYGRKEYIQLRHDKNEWAFGSIGPDAVMPGIGIGSISDYVLRVVNDNYDSMGMDLYPYETEIRRYNGSNGLMSKGDIHYFNTGVPSRYCKEVDGMKRDRAYDNY